MGVTHTSRPAQTSGGRHSIASADVARNQHHEQTLCTPADEHDNPGLKHCIEVVCTLARNSDTGDY